jgi:hypothetical protein
MRGSIRLAAQCRCVPVNPDVKPHMSLTICQPRSWFLPAVLFVFLPVFVLSASPFGSASERQLIGLALYLLLFFLVVWSKLVAGTREVKVFAEQEFIRVAWRDALFRRRHAEFPLKTFDAVFSYVVPSRFPSTRVELSDVTRTKALLLATFPAASVASSFWRIPREGEAEAARSLRISVSRAAGLEDHGFLGWRCPGAQVL